MLISDFEVLLHFEGGGMIAYRRECDRPSELINVKCLSLISCTMEITLNKIVAGEDEEEELYMLPQEVKLSLMLLLYLIFDCLTSMATVNLRQRK